MTSYCFGTIVAYFWRQIYSESASYLSTFGAKTNQDTVPYTSQHSTPSVKAHTSLRRDDAVETALLRGVDFGLDTLNASRGRLDRLDSCPIATIRQRCDALHIVGLARLRLERELHLAARGLSGVRYAKTSLAELS